MQTKERQEGETPYRRLTSPRAYAHQLTKHERQHGGIVLQHHQQGHTPEKQMGLQDAGKAPNTYIHPNVRAAQGTAMTPERGYS